MIHDKRGLALRYKEEEAFSSLKAHFLLLWYSLCLTSQKALFLSISLSLSFFLPFSLRLSINFFVNAERERAKGMTERYNKELLILSMQESESAGRKQEVRFQVIDQTGWHEEDFSLLDMKKQQ